MKALQKAAAVVVGAGKGSRMGAGKNKVFLELADRPMIAWSLAAFQKSQAVSCIVAVVDAGSIARFAEEVIFPYGLDKVTEIVAGGATRRQSVLNGVLMVPSDAEIVLIHDAARPLVDQDLIQRVIDGASAAGACIPVVAAVDTLKRVDPASGRVVETADRGVLRMAQTPQGFKREVILEALERSGSDLEATDDSQLVEGLGIQVSTVEGSRENFKITYPSDLRLAKSLLTGSSSAGSVKVGIGYDIHRVAPSRKLVLGGVEIEGPGLDGHSDADVLIHALMDALLGAAGEADIGTWFPCQEPRWKGASSLDMLSQVRDILSGKGYRVVNADVTLVARSPRLAEHAPAMKERLAGALGVSPGDVGVKFTTNEGCDSLGKGRAMAAWAVASIEPHA